MFTKSFSTQKHIAISVMFVALFFGVTLSVAQATSRPLSESEVSPVPKSTSISELQALVARLMAEIAALQKGSVPTKPRADSTCVADFTRTLYQGSSDTNSDNDVTRLQRFLTSTGHYTYGAPTGYYGPATVEAVKRWQKANGVVSDIYSDNTGFGMLGPSTRSKMRMGCDNPVSHSDVSVKLVRAYSQEMMDTDGRMYIFTLDVTAGKKTVYLRDESFHLGILRNGEARPQQEVAKYPLHVTSLGNAPQTYYEVKAGQTRTFSLTTSFKPSVSGKYVFQLLSPLDYSFDKTFGNSDDASLKFGKFSIPEVSLVAWDPLTMCNTFSGECDRKGTYIGYMNNVQFEKISDVTVLVARQKCNLKKTSNPTAKIHCTFDDKIIFDNRGTDTAPLMPKVNHFSCDRNVTTKLANGALGCYGMWDYNDSFGEDENTCGFHERKTGCVIQTPVCSSGVAKATTYQSKASITAEKLPTIATNLKTTEAAVKAGVAGIWEYSCVPDEIPGPQENRLSCDRSLPTKKNDGMFACYGIWDFDNAFGGDKNMCGTTKAPKTGCVIQAPVCSSGVAKANLYRSSASIFGPTNPRLPANIANGLGVTVPIFKTGIAGLWNYECVPATPAVLGASISLDETLKDLKATLATLVAKLK